MTLTDKLLPCPFCGGENLSIGDTHRGPFVECYSCLSCGPDGGADSWNRRATLADDLNGAARTAERAINDMLIWIILHNKRHEPKIDGPVVAALADGLDALRAAIWSDVKPLADRQLRDQIVGEG